jgi:hypothetical protein
LIEILNINGAEDWDMTLCVLVGNYQHLREPVFCITKVELNPDMTVTLITKFQTALRHIPEDLIFTAVRTSIVAII